MCRSNIHSGPGAVGVARAWHRLRALRSELLVEEEALGGGQECGPRDSAERWMIVARVDALRELISTAEARADALGAGANDEEIS